MSTGHRQGRRQRRKQPPPTLGIPSPPRARPHAAHLCASKRGMRPAQRRMQRGSHEFLPTVRGHVVWGTSGTGGAQNAESCTHTCVRARAHTHGGVALHSRRIWGSNELLDEGARRSEGLLLLDRAGARRLLRAGRSARGARPLPFWSTGRLGSGSGVASRLDLTLLHRAGNARATSRTFRTLVPGAGPVSTHACCWGCNQFALLHIIGIDHGKDRGWTPQPGAACTAQLAAPRRQRWLNCSRHTRQRTETPSVMFVC